VASSTSINFSRGSVVWTWFKTWSLTLREESRLRVFENRVLRRIFGHKRDDVTGEWRRLHNKELYDFNIVHTVHFVFSTHDYS
jgi:hypothetical protein